MRGGMMYKLEIYLDNGFNAKYSNLTIDQVLKELNCYVGIVSVQISLEN